MRLRPVLLLLAFGLALQGCGTVGYYAQSIHGHLELMGQREPIDDLVRDPQTSLELRDRLELVRSIRDFASTNLHLPDNGSYRSYADIGRSHVVWSVVATPELSLTPETWCFPVAGCVSYRGYFSQDGAQAFAEGLRSEGYDVYVAGVAAYSTLGWFDDPVPSSVIRWPEYHLAGLVFHELAHQEVYVTDDSAFNEAFAVTVEREGVRRWLQKQGSGDMLGRYRRSERLQDDFLQLVFVTRERLEGVYGSDLPDAEKRRRKARVFDEMRAAYAPLRARWGGDGRYDKWFAREPNNAQLAAVVTYHDLVPGFEALLARHQGDLEAFYMAVGTLSREHREARRLRLMALADHGAVLHGAGG